MAFSPVYEVAEIGESKSLPPWTCEFNTFFLLPLFLIAFFGFMGHKMAHAENPVHRIGLKVLNLGIHKRNGLGLR